MSSSRIQPEAAEAASVPVLTITITGTVTAAGINLDPEVGLDSDVLMDDEVHDLLPALLANLFHSVIEGRGIDLAGLPAVPREG